MLAPRPDVPGAKGSGALLGSTCGAGSCASTRTSPIRTAASTAASHPSPGSTTRFPYIHQPQRVDGPGQAAVSALPVAGVGSRTTARPACTGRVVDRHTSIYGRHRIVPLPPLNARPSTAHEARSRSTASSSSSPARMVAVRASHMIHRARQRPADDLGQRSAGRPLDQNARHLAQLDVGVLRDVFQHLPALLGPQTADRDDHTDRLVDESVRNHGRAELLDLLLQDRDPVRVLAALDHVPKLPRRRRQGQPSGERFHHRQYKTKKLLLTNHMPKPVAGIRQSMETLTFDSDNLEEPRNSSAMPMPGCASAAIPPAPAGPVSTARASTRSASTKSTWTSR